MFANKPNVLCNTDFRKTNFTFKWTISNFSLCDCDRSIQSSIFKFGTATWRLKLSDETENKEKKNAKGKPAMERYLKLSQLFLSSKGSSGRPTQENPNTELTVDFTMHAIDAKDKLVLLRETKYRAIRSKEDAEDEDDEDGEFVPIVDGNLLSDDDQLRFIFRITTVKESVQDINEGFSEECYSFYERNDFGDLLESGDFSDVTLVVENKEIRVHKNILATKSSVFKAMFQHEKKENRSNEVNIDDGVFECMYGLKENQENKVKIDDMTYECVYEMMRFMYTGTVKNLHRLAGKLLNAADKYDLQKLQMHCGKALFDNLTVETSAETLVQSDMHNLEELKEHTIEFIKERSSGVKLTEGWKMMIKTHPHLVIECFIF